MSQRNFEKFIGSDQQISRGLVATRGFAPIVGKKKFFPSVCCTIVRVCLFCDCVEFISQVMTQHILILGSVSAYSVDTL